MDAPAGVELPHGPPGLRQGPQRVGPALQGREPSQVAGVEEQLSLPPRSGGRAGVGGCLPVLPCPPSQPPPASRGGGATPRTATSVGPPGTSPAHARSSAIPAATTSRASCSPASSSPPKAPRAAIQGRFSAASRSSTVASLIFASTSGPSFPSVRLSEGTERPVVPATIRRW